MTTSTQQMNHNSSVSIPTAAEVANMSDVDIETLFFSMLNAIIADNNRPLTADEQRLADEYQARYDRVSDYILDAGLDAGDMMSAAYALMW